MKQMYKGKAFSPNAIITKTIGPTNAVIEVDNIEAFPPGPNLATIGVDALGETILYSQIVDNKLSGCTRGIEGTAKTWLAGEIIARNFTNEDLVRLIDNVNSLDSDKVDNSRVLTDVPVDAKFTDTTYDEIPAAEIDTGTSSTPRTISARRLKYVIDKIKVEIDSLDSNKVDKEDGKGLSTNDYTNVDKAKVDNIPSNPKYSDTIYDDTVLKTRIEAVENREDKDTTYDVATTTTDGLMSSADKTKLNELNYTRAMTQSQYNALSTSEKNRADVWYGIY